MGIISFFACASLAARTKPHGVVAHLDLFLLPNGLDKMQAISGFQGEFEIMRA